MQKIIINGGKRLVGEVKISGAKNAALPIMIASILSAQDLELNNIPDLEDIKTVVELLQTLGVQTTKTSKNSYILNASNITSFTAPYDIVSKMRASIWTLAPLLARFGKAQVSLPGGCAIGARQVDLHIDVLKAMGAEITIEDGYIIAKSGSNRLSGCEFNFQKISVGATITGILAATLASGVTRLLNCAREPEIVDLCNMLNKMGAKIKGAGTLEVEIEGVLELFGVKHQILADRIEAGTYLVAGAITKGSLKITNIEYDLVKNICEKLEEAGAIITHSENGIHIVADKIHSFDIDTEPFPGFPTDMQAQFTALATIAGGKSHIREHIFENRFMHIPELGRMSADISINGNTAVIQGVTELKGAEVMATDLRASVSLILAGLVACGKTTVSRIYHLDRGYENLEEKLRLCGADIERSSA
jgi:UDP-N-acetylglucosamine 1-carboxyvinyltransferase